MPALGFSLEVRSSLHFCSGWAFWRSRSRLSGDGAPSLVRRVLLTLYLVVLWLAWVGGLLGLLWLGIFSLLLPAAVRGVGRLAQIWAARAKRTGAFGVMLNVLIVRGARAVVIAAAVAWLAYIWRIRAAALAGSETGSDRSYPGCSTASSFSWWPT